MHRCVEKSCLYDESKLLNSQSVLKTEAVELRFSDVCDRSAGMCIYIYIRTWGWMSLNKANNTNKTELKSTNKTGERNAPCIVGSVYV